MPLRPGFSRLARGVAEPSIRTVGRLAACPSVKPVWGFSVPDGWRRRAAD